MNYSAIRLVVFGLYNKADAVNMLRRRHLYASAEATIEVDVELWRQCVNYLELYMLLPWFIPKIVFQLLPIELCKFISKFGLRSHLDVMDDEYYLNSGHGIASIDFIIKSVDDVFLSRMSPPPLRRSCTGWYATCNIQPLEMTDAERIWIHDNSLNNMIRYI